MSQGPQTDDLVTVSNDGVVVEKTVTAEEFPVPAVAFTLTSNTDVPVHIRLTDQIPSSFPMERVGFHPDYHSNAWTAYKNHRVEFEYTLDPTETIETVYGIRTDDSEELQQFLTEPEIKEIATSEDDPTDIEGVLGSDNSQLIREVLAGERSSLPGADAGDTPIDAPLDPSESDVDPETPPAEAGDGTPPADEPPTTNPNTGVDDTTASEPPTDAASAVDDTTADDDSGPTDTEMTATAADADETDDVDPIDDLDIDADPTEADDEWGPETGPGAESEAVDDDRRPHHAARQELRRTLRRHRPALPSAQHANQHRRSVGRVHA